MFINVKIKKIEKINLFKVVNNIILSFLSGLGKGKNLVTFPGLEVFRGFFM